MEDNDDSEMAASLSTLPEEILLHIFSFLPPEDLMFGVGATCRLFNDLSLSHSLWKQIIVTRICPDLSPELDLEPIKSRYSSTRFYRNLLQQRCIGSGSNGSESGAGATGNRRLRWKKPVRKLIRSVEERGDIWPSCSVTGAMHYPNLERLKLLRENLLSVEVLVKHQGLQHLQLCTSHLVDHDNSHNANGQLLIDLFENLKGLTDLQTLTLHFSCSQCRENIPSIFDVQASMKDYFLTGLKLRKIQLNSFVNDEIFQAILDNCLLLEDLAINRPELKPKAFCTAISRKRQLLLSSLRIDRCETLNDSCLLALPFAFPNIKSLRLSLTGEITSDVLGLLLRAFSQLTKLELGLKVSNGHITKMLGGKTSENLQFLGLFAMTFHSAWAFTKLCQNSRNLREIELIGTNIGNTEVITMVNICRLLEKVTVYECSHVESSGAAFLMKNLPRLQKFICKLLYPRLFQLEQLSPSQKRTRAGDFVWMNQPPTESRLWSLHLYYCQELTVVGISALAVLYSNLRDLTIRTSEGMNDHTVTVILRSLPNLQHLRLTRTEETDRQNQLTAAGLYQVQRWGTRLETLHLMTCYRSFSIAALVRILAHSSTLVDCVVPHNSELSPDIPYREMARIMTHQQDRLQWQGKNVRWRHMNYEGIDLLHLHIFQV